MPSARRNAALEAAVSSPPATASALAPPERAVAAPPPAAMLAALPAIRDADLPSASHIGQPCPGLAECPERPRLVRRLYDAAEKEIEAVEKSLGGRSATAARRLGALAATLDRLTALDRKAAGSAGAKARSGEAHAEAVTAPVDAEAWAENLAAQLGPGKARNTGGAA